MTHYEYYYASSTVYTPNKAVVEFVKTIHNLFVSIVYLFKKKLLTLHLFKSLTILVRIQ